MSDTIAAIATAPGQGGIAIVRVSGDMAEDILRRIFRPVGGKHPLPTHLLTYGYIVEDTERIDECMAVIMRAPNRTHARMWWSSSCTAAAVLRRRCLRCACPPAHA